MLRFRNYIGNTIKGILVAYLVLILHIVLLAGLGILIIFFRGIINYMAWILFISIILTLIFIFLFYIKIRRLNKPVKKLISNIGSNRCNFEINFFGGLASLKLQQPMFKNISNGIKTDKKIQQFDLYEYSRINKVTKLALLLEKNLITLDEYNEAKRDIFQL